VGVTTAAMVLIRELDDVMLIDIKEKENAVKGEALDLNHMASALGLSVKAYGSADYKDMEGSDLVIVTAGFRAGALGKGLRLGRLQGHGGL